MPAKGSRKGVMKICRACGERFYCVPSLVDKQKYCGRYCRYDDPEFLNLLSKNTKKAWTSERREKWSEYMSGDSKHQLSMQLGGNQQRVGKPNKGAQKWWDSTSDEFRKQWSENLSRKMAAIVRKKGIIASGYVKAKQGYLDTRFDRIRYDSGWEKLFIEVMEKRKDVVDLTRDILVYYRQHGIKRRFLVDFCVEFKKRKPILVEIKCPYFLGTRNTKLKIRAAKKYAKKHHMRFVLLASREQVGDTEYV